MTKITSGEKSGIETVKLFAMPSGGSNKAISITEVSCFRNNSLKNGVKSRREIIQFNKKT